MKRIVLVFAAVMGMGYAMACTNFLVGKDASVDGSTIISYAADSYTLYGFLHFSPAADHAAGDWDATEVDRVNVSGLVDALKTEITTTKNAIEASMISKYKNNLYKEDYD